MPALNAGLLAAAQAVEHYEITVTLRTWAKELAYKDAVKLLDATLKEEKNTESALGQLAGSEVNQQAGSGPRAAPKQNNLKALAYLCIDTLRSLPSPSGSALSIFIEC